MNIKKQVEKNDDKYEQKIQELEKQLEENEEYINIDAIKDKAQKDINELNILKDKNEQEIKNFKNQLNDKDISLTKYEQKLDKLKDIYEQEKKIKR